MAAPSIESGAGGGSTDAGGAWTGPTMNSPAGAGRVVIVGILQDGTTTGAVAVTGATNIENLAGTDNAWTQIVADSPCGSPTAALLHLYIGRTLSSSAPTISGTNSTSEDLYMQQAGYFIDVSAGTTLATVIENGTAGSTANGVGTGTTVSDTGVTTLGPDRLAVNYLGANDDGMGVLEFSGESGGDWSAFSVFASASGTDGTCGYCTATIASAGTIDGGTLTSAVSVGWGIRGFALIGTTVAAQIEAPSLVALQAVNRGASF